MTLLLCQSRGLGLGLWSWGAGGHLVEAGAVTGGQHVNAVWVSGVGGAGGGEGGVHGRVLGCRGDLVVGTLRQVDEALGWAGLVR